MNEYEKLDLALDYLNEGIFDRFKKNKKEEIPDPDKIKSILKSDKNYNNEEEPVEYLDDEELKDAYKAKRFFDEFIKKYHEDASIKYTLFGVDIFMYSDRNKNELLRQYEKLYNDTKEDTSQDEINRRVDKIDKDYKNRKLKAPIMAACKATGQNIDMEDDVTIYESYGTSDDKFIVGAQISIRLV